MRKYEQHREVLEILNKIKNSKKIKILDREVNYSFMKSNGYTETDVINIIKGLKEKDYRYKYINKDKKIKAKELYVFHQKWYGYSLDGIKDIDDIFIKICYLENDNEIIIVVSFHNS